MASAPKPLWIAGPAFRCKGEALKDDYAGVHFSVTDMKRNVQRLYETKRRRSKTGTPEEGVWPLLHEHKTEHQLGEVYDAFIDKDMNMWNIMRISPGSASANHIVKGIRETVSNNLADTKKHSFGLSYGYRMNDYVNMTHPTDRKHILELTLTENPAHHEDGTYVRLWSESREDLLKNLFNGVYGASVDSSEGKPVYMPNVLKAEVRKVFGEVTEDKMDLDPPADVPPEKPSASKDTAAIPPIPASDAPVLSEKAANVSKEDAMQIDTPLPATTPSVAEGRAQGGGDISTPPSQPVSSGEAAQVFENKVDKDVTAPGQTTASPSTSVSSLPPPGKGISSSSTLPDMSSTSSTVDSMELDPGQKSAPATPPTGLAQQQKVASTPAPAPKRPLEKDIAPPPPPPKEEKEAPAQQQSPPDVPATKKQRDTAGNPRPTSYALNERDVSVASQAFQRELSELVKIADLADASPEEQAAYLKSIVDEKRQAVAERRRVMEEMSRAVLTDYGISDEDAKAAADVINSQGDSPAGQVMRTLLTAAASSAGNPRLVEQSLRNASPSIYNTDQQSTGSRSVIRGPSIIPGFQDRTPHLESVLQKPVQQQQQQTMMAPPPRRNLDFMDAIMTGRRPASNPRLGEQSSAPVPPPADPQKDYDDMIAKFKEVAPFRIRGYSRLDEHSNFLMSLRTPQGDTALDTLDLPEHALETVRPNSFASQFMHAFSMPDLDAIKAKAFVPYGHDEINAAYYASLRPETNGIHAPRVIHGGRVSMADEF